MIKMIIVDDHPIFRRGLASMIEDVSDIEIVAECDGNNLFELCEFHAPQILSLDINLNGIDGFELTKEITENHPKIKILIVSMYNSLSYVKKSFKSGASGFISKNGAADNFRTAIKIVADGGLYFPRIIFEQQLETRTIGDSNRCNYHLLTSREQEIAKLLFDGLGYKEIAYKINISPKTVESHRNNILKKSNCRSIQEFCKLGISEGVFDL